VELPGGPLAYWAAMGAGMSRLPPGRSALRPIASDDSFMAESVGAVDQRCCVPWWYPAGFGCWHGSRVRLLSATISAR
jgi:hypothetical protein